MFPPTHLPNERRIDRVEGSDERESTIQNPRLSTKTRHVNPPPPIRKTDTERKTRIEHEPSETRESNNRTRPRCLETSRKSERVVARKLRRRKTGGSSPNRSKASWLKPNQLPTEATKHRPREVVPFDQWLTMGDEVDQIRPRSCLSTRPTH